MISRSTLKLLAVDDVEGNLLVLEALLRQPDLEILLARSGQEALELLLEHDVALALIDVQMPEMDGFELAELMRGAERTRAIPIIFVTAGVRDLERVFRGYDLGAVDFLFKPVEAPILRQKVNVFVELRRQREQLADALRLNETFVAVLAHDLRTPLSAISLSIDALTVSNDATASTIAAKLQTSVRRMSGMIEQLCDVSRARLGRGFTLDSREHEVMALVRRVIAEIELSVPARSIVLRGPTSLLAVWDEGRIAQALSNIVGNAVRHGDPAQPIEVRVETQGSEAVIKVCNGGTMSDEVRAELFSPFKSRPRGSHHDGLGLGLYIAEQLVRAHHGHIDVTSTEGTTVVRVVLPLLTPRA